MADTPYEVVRDVRLTLIDHIDYLWRRSPLELAQAERATAHLLAPLGTPVAHKRAADMYAAHRDDEPEAFDRHMERAVSDLMHVIGDAVRAEVHGSVGSSLRRLGLLHVNPLPQTPLTGVSPTTAGEEVTGPVGGSNAGPVTPPRVYMEDGCPIAWVHDPLPGGVVCAVADPSHPDGLCGMPVEDVPCTVHYPGSRR